MPARALRRAAEVLRGGGDHHAFIVASGSEIGTALVSPSSVRKISFHYVLSVIRGCFIIGIAFALAQSIQGGVKRILIVLVAVVDGVFV